MIKIVYFLLAGFLFKCVWSMGSMIDHGLWEVKAVNECEDPEQHPFVIKVERRKLNRTHDMFNSWLDFKKKLDESYGIKIEICKWVDGGCKDYTVLTDNNIVEFSKKMAEGNQKAVFKMIGIETGDFPVEAGEYECENYLIDYCEFPCKSVLGLFDAEVLLVDQDGNTQACLIATIEFREPNDDEELCEKCKEEQ